MNLDCNCQSDNLEFLDKLEIYLRNLLNFENIKQHDFLSKKFLNNKWMPVTSVYEVIQKEQNFPELTDLGEFLHYLKHLKCVISFDNLYSQIAVEQGEATQRQTITIFKTTQSIKRFLDLLKNSNFSSKVKVKKIQDQQIDVEFTSMVIQEAFNQWMKHFKKEQSPQREYIAQKQLANINLNINAKPFSPTAESYFDTQQNQERNQQVIQQMYKYYYGLMVKQQRRQLLQNTEDTQDKEDTSIFSQDFQNDDLVDQGTQLLYPSTLTNGNSSALEGYFQHNPNIAIRFTNQQLLKIFRNCGKFIHPLEQLDKYGVSENNDQVINAIEEITNVKPDVVLEMIKEDSTKIGINGFKDKAFKNVQSELNRALTRWRA